MKPILEIQNISKKFRINHEQQPYLSIRDSVATIFKNKTSKEDFWALQDVTFDVMPGDTVGIIGKNGAGKSTLLKILSKITPPTSGKIISRGRIASLLEVGTGFHPELTGRENIFMNGSILGMKRVEILKNFDAIITFAGIEKFIDTPLKHYSSGMQLRLAFSVAAFLENEILIIDEVLAVGDAEFQKKCIGKMDDVSKNGRTVLFVSHHMGVLESLCKQSVLLKNGALMMKSNSAEVINEYISSFNQYETQVSKKNKSDAFIKEVYFGNKSGVKSAFELNEDVVITIAWQNVAGVNVNVNIEIVNIFGTKLFFSVDTTIDRNGTAKNKAGTYESKVTIPKNLLNIGQYIVHVGLDSAVPQINYDAYLNSCYFSIIDNLSYSSHLKGDFVGVNTTQHALQPLLNWEFKLIL